MRSITRAPDQGFEDTVRDVVRGSPWWLISLVVHAVALAVLWSIPIATEQHEAVAAICAVGTPEMLPPENTPLTPPDVKQPDEKIVEQFLLDPTEDEQPSIYTDNSTPDLAGTGEGIAEGELTGVSTNPDIGTGGSAAGGHKGTGRPRTGRGSGHGTPLAGKIDLGLKWLADHQDVDEDGTLGLRRLHEARPGRRQVRRRRAARSTTWASRASRSSPSSARATRTAAATQNEFAKNVARGPPLPEERARTPTAASAARASALLHVQPRDRARSRCSRRTG